MVKFVSASIIQSIVTPYWFYDTVTLSIHKDNLECLLE